MQQTSEFLDQTEHRKAYSDQFSSRVLNPDLEEMSNLGPYCPLFKPLRVMMSDNKQYFETPLNVESITFEPLCGTSQNSHHALETNIDIQDSVLLQCVFCRQKFYSQKALLSHMNEQHSNEESLSPMLCVGNFQTIEHPHWLYTHETFQKSN
ncbi:Hypothetical predicted protein [Cloeon dipterum]|uniref:C2H2-type domain-containing protein n=1 Tax=Cloeon dipterum TaxID=197152 RepID=A0A8S1DGK5_9INSE|nr:Hypothetical predicted protein [Cloeon dipterum]